MAISASTSATSSAQQLLKTRQQNPTEQTLAAKTSDEADKARQALPQASQTEQPNPVVNTQGQTTGRIVNITA